MKYGKCIATIHNAIIDLNYRDNVLLEKRENK